VIDCFPPPTLRSTPGTMNVVGAGNRRVGVDDDLRVATLGAPLKKRHRGRPRRWATCAGKVTFAFANPVPMIDDLQALRATGGVVFSSFDGLQVGSPLEVDLDLIVEDRRRREQLRRGIGVS